jgi:hypothetical protein
VGGGIFSVVWCQPIGLMQMAGGRGAIIISAPGKLILDT